MPTQLTATDARESLTAHVAAKGAEAFAKYGPRLGWRELQQLLEDRALVRYPCEVRFESQPLWSEECAHAAPKGDRPEDGFTIFVHPIFMTQLPQVPLLVLYQLVRVNYGEFATADNAEAFGANALGLDPEDYYLRLCELADQLHLC